MNWKACLLIALALTAGACRSSSRDDGAPPPTVDWGVDDVEALSKTLVDDLLDSPELSYVASAGRGDDMRVPAYVAGVANETNQRIDREAFLGAVERLLLASGRFRLVNEGGAEIPEGERPKGPRKAPRLTPDLACERGHEFGAELAIYVVFRAKKDGKRDDGTRVYSLQLSCLDTGSGDSIWGTTRDIVGSDADFFVSR